MRLLAAGLALSLVACGGGGCPPGTVAAGERCVLPDAGLDGAVGADAGQDGGGDARLPCGGTCTGMTSHCLVTGSSETCVGCVSATDCSGTRPVCDTAGDHTCVACVVESDCTGGTHCETTSRTCVACLDSTQCGNASAARCDPTSHACAACATSADCMHLTATPVCGAGGTCVQCTAADESACGANVCDVAAGTCTTTPAGSVGVCMPCTSDRACATGTACVLERFDSSLGSGTFVDVGQYCLPTGATCPLTSRPFVSPTMLRNVAGTMVAVCDLAVATCPAYLAYGSATCTMNSDCGAPSLDDALCRPRSGFGMQCTTRCGGPEDCIVGFGCSASAPSYCCFGAACT